MISILLVYMMSDTARAFTHATVTGIGEPIDCVEAEVRRRTVALRTDRTSCSGVIIDPLHVRTAGRCFGMFEHVSWTGDALGVRRTDRTTVRRAGGAQYLMPDQPDQAEVTFPKSMSLFPPVERVDLDQLADGATVVLAGFGWAGFVKPFWRSFSSAPKLTWVRGTLTIERGTGRARGRTNYVVTPDDVATRLGASDVGGPAFVVEGCRIRWLGTILSRRIWPGTAARIFVRPHTDLN